MLEQEDEEWHDSNEEGPDEFGAEEDDLTSVVTGERVLSSLYALAKPMDNAFLKWFD